MEWRPALCNSPEPSSLGRRRGEDPQAAVDPEPLGSKWISGFDTSFENSPDRSTPVLCRSVFGCRQFVTRPFVKISDDGRFRLSRSGLLNTTGARAPKGTDLGSARAFRLFVRSRMADASVVNFRYATNSKRRDGEKISLFLQFSHDFSASLGRVVTETRPRTAETTRPFPGDAQRVRRRHGRPTRLEAAQDLGGRLPRARRRHGHV